MSELARFSLVGECDPLVEASRKVAEVVQNETLVSPETQSSEPAPFNTSLRIRERTRKPVPFTPSVADKNSMDERESQVVF